MKFIPFITQSLMWLIARPLLSLFAGIRVYGKENTDLVPHNAIIAMNHVSQLDPIMIPATLSPFSHLMPVFSISLKPSFYKIESPIKYLYGGWIFRMLGSHPIAVGTKGDYEETLKEGIRVLEQGGSLGIFPEGRRTRDGKMGEAKSGVAYLLWRTGVPVIPVAFHGHYMMKPKHFFSRKHTISVLYGKPITREEMFGPHNAEHVPTREEFKAIAQKILDRVKELYDQCD